MAGIQGLTGYLTYEIGGVTVEDYLFALGVFVAALIILRIFKFVIINQLKKLSKKTKSNMDDALIEAIDAVGWPFYILVSIYAGTRFAAIPQLADTALYFLILVAAGFYGVIAAQKIVDRATKKMKDYRKGTERDSDTSMIDLLGKIVKGVLWFVAALLILSNIGYDISALMAGLGIGGIAIAFALQNVLTDIFASFSLYFDKPFKVGDYIVVGTDSGIVKKIGIKSTRMQTLQGEELVISNKELTETRVHNYKKMEKRRINFKIGVTYDTSTEKLKKIPVIIEEIIGGIELAYLDRVHFSAFGDFSLIYDIVYYVGSSEYAKYMNILQEINLAIRERFEKEGIEMAYPTQTIFVKK